MFNVLFLELILYIVLFSWQIKANNLIQLYLIVPECIIDLLTRKQKVHIL